MYRVDIYEYDPKDRQLMFDAIEKRKGVIFSVSYFEKSNEEIMKEVSLGAAPLFIDLSNLFYNSDRIDYQVCTLEALLGLAYKFQEGSAYLIIDRQYSATVKDLLYYKVRDILDINQIIRVSKNVNNDIVSLRNDEFDSVMEYMGKNLFGNNQFKIRLKEELCKYRVFNRIHQQPIFSMFICGPSGIGKTEVARILHRKLFPNEPMIKINFGNYSTHDALNSLIGSPRGYVGSNTGELPEKLTHSQSKIILIDEFEKASSPVYNFFLQLLEDGRFTDSLGREYDLDKYIIIFTSNMPKEKIKSHFSPELLSRFNYKCAFSPLRIEEKRAYVEFKGGQYLEDLKAACPRINKDLSVEDVITIDVDKYSNMRSINMEIKAQLTEKLYSQICDI